MRRCSRHLLFPGIALVLGAVTGVVVAWGIAITAGEKIVSPSSERGMLTETGMITFGESRGVGRRARWIGNPKVIYSPATPEKVAATRAEWTASLAAMPRVPLVDRVIAWGDLDRPHDWLARRRQYAFGFPVVCVWYERSGGLSMFGSAARLHGGFEVARKRSGLVAEGAIGYRPIWAGLAINAVVYGVVWMGVMKLVGVWMARRRARAGCCRRCGYSLKELPDGAVCPECGGGGVMGGR